jgi:hypothetical protein
MKAEMAIFQEILSQILMMIYMKSSTTEELLWNCEYYRIFCNSFHLVINKLQFFKHIMSILSDMGNSE